jgi:Na+/melibiose symporter-like transporter
VRRGERGLGVTKIKIGTKLAFGLGQMAEGIKNYGFNLFLLFYYTQVLGLSGTLAGAAILIALVFDAVTDPLAGSISDSLHHRWGRRHPFMYASAVPLGLFFWLVFSPPEGLGHIGLFAWLTTFTILTRGAMTLYHVPHLALGAELSSDYNERNVIVAYRNFFGAVGIAFIIYVGFTVFFHKTPGFEFGQRNPAAYAPFGLFFGAAMAITILVSAIGTHSRIPHLPSAPAKQQGFRASKLLREVSEAGANRSFRVLLVGLILFFTARGIESVLSLHMGTFFWGLPSEEYRLVPLIGIAGVMIGTPVFAVALRWIEKKPALIFSILWFSAITMAMPILKILGLYPPRESSLYLQLLILSSFIAAFGGSAGLIASGSMLADIADEHEVNTGRRQEGIFFGALSFSGKASHGVGGLIAGIGLDLIRFPAQVDPGQVPEGTLIALGLLYGPGVFAAALVAVAFFVGYRLDRSRHAEIQEELFQRRVADSFEREGQREATVPRAAVGGD